MELLKLCKAHILVVMLMWTGFSYGQIQPQLKHVTLTINNSKIRLDTASIDVKSFDIKDTVGNRIHADQYTLLPFSGELIWKGELPTIVHITYRTLAFDFSKTYQNKDSSVMHRIDTSELIKNYVFSAQPNRNTDLFQTGGINKTGSISRGVLFGNNQNLSVNSSLNLQLSGKLSEDIEIIASISDDNIPIQPAGNTQQLQDFDQVYIQILGANWKLQAGDFWLKKPTGYFMTYNKRAQGASFEYTNRFQTNKGDTVRQHNRFSAALSKGKFARNIIQGIENNQGPYRLKGADNEMFIIILSGTELVYIDGELLQRGQQYDYIIDYNTAEITFTANRMITKDKRIIVEFQYSDKNYARSIVETSHTFQYNQWNFFMNVYSEQDAKNQPLQQELSDFDKEILFNAGDNLLNMLANGADSIGFEQNAVMYQKKDTLGYTIFLYSNQPETAVYRVVFTDLGPGNGNYQQIENSAFGRVFQWIAPDTINGVVVPKGRFEPVRVLIPPKKRQMVTAGIGRKLNENWSTLLELAYSNYDVNTFSPLDSQDNEGYGLKYYLNGKKKISTDLVWTNKLNIELVSSHFQPIERFREVEFTRNWNTTNLPINRQYLGGFSSGIQHKHYQFTYGINGFYQPGDYEGLKQDLTVESTQFVRSKLQSSYLISNGAVDSRFYRHKANVSKQFGKIVNVGYEDELEYNAQYALDSLLPSGYSFYDYQFYVSNHDSSINRFKVFYRERIDWGISNQLFLAATRAINPGIEIGLNKNPNQQITARMNYRKLTVSPGAFVIQEPDNTLLNRFEHRGRWLKNGITSHLFYEFGSGLELRREFAYIEVPAGQGTYYWIDYNENGIKELDEFEIAQFPDQALYIRVSTPSNNYVKVYNNQLSEVISINPRNFIKGDERWKKTLTRFNTQTNLRLERKTTLDELIDNFNPFIRNIADTNLQATNSSFRNSTFFNRINPKFGIEHTFLNLRSKSLLFTGFDERKRKQNEIKIRYAINTDHTLFLTYEYELKYNRSDFAPSRTYDLTISNAGFRWVFQPSTVSRFGVIINYKEKMNAPSLSNDQAFLTEVGIEGKLNKLNKGTLNVQAKYVGIKYNGESYSPLAFEMLESLQKGNNLTWTLSFQRNFANNLQLTLNYNGRKSEGATAVHIGGMQLRAFF
jgi:hypothetical protein